MIRGDLKDVTLTSVHIIIGMMNVEIGKLLSIIPTIQKAGIDSSLPISPYNDKRLISIFPSKFFKNC